MRATFSYLLTGTQLTYRAALVAARVGGIQDRSAHTLIRGWRANDWVKTYKATAGRNAGREVIRLTSSGKRVAAAIGVGPQPYTVDRFHTVHLGARHGPIWEPGLDNRGQK